MSAITAKFRKGLGTVTVTLYPASATVFVQYKAPLQGTSTAKLVRPDADSAARTASAYFDRYQANGWKLITA